MTAPKKSSKTPERQPRATGKRAYTAPQLSRYGSLASLTRSGTGTVMEGGGPARRQFPA
jgi:hypothetical protein